MRDLLPEHWKARIQRFLLALDAWVDFSMFRSFSRRCAKPMSASPPSWTASTSPAGGAGSTSWSRKAPRSAPLGARADAGAGDPGVPRDLGRRLAEEVGARGHLPRPLRQRGRLARHPAQRLDPARPVSRSPDQGGARRPRTGASTSISASTSPAPRARSSPTRAPAASCRAAPPSPSSSPRTCSCQQRAHARAQDQGSLPGDVAGSAADQERDPQALSRPRLYGRRRLRRRCGRAVLLQQVGARREPVGSRDARRPVQGADQVRAARQPAGRARARQRRARQPGRSRH